MNTLEKFSFYILLIWIVSTATLTRSVHYSNYLFIIKETIEYLQFYVPILCLFTSDNKKSRRVLSFVSFCFLLIFIHSVSNFYQPSLRLGVPFQDYFLHDFVSSNYSLNLCKRYLWNIFICIPSSIVVADLLKRRLIKANWIVFCFLTCLIINATVALAQGLYDIRFLSTGSGNSVAAKRAAGLLEDSGASNIYLSTLTTGLIFMSLGLKNAQIATKSILMILIVFVFFAGTFAGGRIFFVSTTIGTFVGCFIFLIRNKLKKIRAAHAIPLLSVPAIVVTLTYFFPTERLEKLFASIVDFSKNIFEEHALLNTLKQIDHGRISHHFTMWQSFIEHPVFGTGIGGFHADNLYYTAKLGLFKLVDSPSSFYFMLLSGLGIASLLLFILGVLASRNLLQRVFADSDHQGSQDFINFAAGALISLLISLSIGMHFDFISVSSTVILISISWIISNKNQHYYKYLAVAFACLLMLGISYNTLTSKPVPEFRWHERSRPQEPLPFFVPISSRGHQGQWMQSGNELIYDGNKSQIFVELPPEYYPLSINIKLFSKNWTYISEINETIREYTLEKPWHLISIDFPAAAKNECATYTSKDFCFIRISTSPSWRFEGKRIGFFKVSS